MPSKPIAKELPTTLATTPTSARRRSALDFSVHAPLFPLFGWLDADARADAGDHAHADARDSGVTSDWIAYGLRDKKKVKG